MESLDRLKATIKNLEDRELVTYSGAFFALMLLLMGLLFFFHYRKVSYYKQELKRVDVQRAETKKILSNYKVAKAHSQKVEEILAEHADFLIGEAFQAIIQRAGLSNRVQNQTAPTTGESVSGKTEIQVSAQLTRLSMKNVTDLLLAIAQVPQLYTKDLSIKKETGSPAVDLDITIATLELSSAE